MRMAAKGMVIYSVPEQRIVAIDLDREIDIALNTTVDVFWNAPNPIHPCKAPKPLQLWDVKYVSGGELEAWMIHWKDDVKFNDLDSAHGHWWPAAHCPNCGEALK